MGEDDESFDDSEEEEEDDSTIMSTSTDGGSTSGKRYEGRGRGWEGPGGQETQWAAGQHESPGEGVLVMADPRANPTGVWVDLG